MNGVRKRLKKVFQWALIIWSFFLIGRYVAFQLLIGQKNMQVVIEVEAKSSSNLEVSYNIPPNGYGSEIFDVSINGNQSSEKIYLPIRQDQVIKQIFIQSDSPATFGVKSIYIDNSYEKIIFDSNQLQDGLKYSTKEEQLGLVDGKVIAQLDADYSLIVENKICAEIYNQLERNLYPYSVGISTILLTLLLLIIKKYEKKEELIKVKKTTFIMVFLTIIISFFFLEKHHESGENRVLSPFPDFRINIWRIPPKYSKYYVDHFPYREEMAQLNNYLKYYLFRVSPNPIKARIGKDGWLYYSTRRIKKVYQGFYKFNDEELSKIQYRLESMQDSLAKKGIDFYLVLPPLKHTVYPEYLPFGMEIIGKTKREQIIKFLKQNSKIKLIDPLPILLDLKDSIRVYYKNDTHWNQLGAFKVYQQIIDSIRAYHPSIDPPLLLSDYNVKHVESYEGDLIPLLNLRDIFKRDAYFMDKKSSKLSGPILEGKSINNEMKYIYYDSKILSDKPRMLMYRDSYAEYLHKHLSEHFSYSGYIWGRKIEQARIDDVKPDIIVLELMERFVDFLLTGEEQ